MDYTVRNPRGIATSGLASCAFARHYLRNLDWFLFLALLRCFSSGGSLPVPIWFSTGYLAVGFPIRKSPDRSSFAAPRSLSQLITSFIGSWCQGIPLALFIAWPFVEINEANSANPAWLTPCVIRSLASSFLLSNQNPLALGFWFVKRTKTRCSLRSLFNTSQLIDSPIGSLYSWIMQAHVLEVFL